MVSRSLEKMILIAVGLSTAVIVGVPILMYTIDTLVATSQLEMATTFAERVHNSTESVDSESTPNVLIEINMPSGVTITEDGNTLTIRYEQGGSIIQTWSETYTHAIELVAPEESGSYFLSITLDEGTLRIMFLLPT